MSSEQLASNNETVKESVVVGRGSIVLVVGRLIGIFLSFFITILITRMLGPANYGIFSFVINIPLLFISILNSTLILSLTRYIPEYACRKEFGKVKAIYLKVLKITVVSGLVFSLILFVVAFFLPYSSTIIISIPYLLIALVMFNFATFFYTMKKMHLYVLEYSMTRVFIVIFVLFFTTWLGVAGAITSYTVATLLTSVFLGFFIFNFLRKVKIKKIDISYRKIFSISAPFGISRILSSVNGTIGTFLLTYFAFIFTMAEVGYFNLASGIISVFGIIATAVPEVVGPTLIGYFSNKKSEIGKKSFNLVLKYLLIFMLPAIFSLVVTADNLVPLLFGPQYVKAALLVKIFSFSALSLALYKLIGSIVTVYNKFNYYLFAEIISLVSMVIIDLLLISTYGSLGATIAYVVSVFTGTIFLFYSGVKIARINIEKLNIVKILFSSLLFILPIFILPQSLIVLIPLLGVIVLIYIGLLFLLRVINWQDIKLITSAIKK